MASPIFIINVSGLSIIPFIFKQPKTSGYTFSTFASIPILFLDIASHLYFFSTLVVAALYTVPRTTTKLVYGHNCKSLREKMVHRILFIVFRFVVSFNIGNL